MSVRIWIIAAAVLLGLCALNSYTGDSVQDEQRAADHKAETIAAMNSRAKSDAQIKRAHIEKRLREMVAYDQIKVTK